MRSIAVIVAAGILSVFAFPLAAPVAQGQAPGTPKLSVTVLGETENDEFVFKEASSGENIILVPQLPIVLNVTFHNNETLPIIHTFTINDDEGTLRLNSGNVSTGSTAFVEFTLESLDRINTTGGVSFAPERGDRGILFYCIPHRGAGMVGEIVLASLAEEPPDKGIFLRAYWIGLIGIFATVGWIAVSYFVIRSSSPRFKGHQEHLRKGLP